MRMNEVKERNDDSEFKALLCADGIESVDNNSDEKMNMQRARIHFKNGHNLSVIRGPYSSGGDEGFFEIMPSSESFFDDEHSGDSVCGYLTADQVSYYIKKIGGLGA